MEKIKLLYVHGYLGHGNGSASQLIKAELDKRGVQYSLDAPDFPVTKPSLMRKMLTELIAGGKYDYFSVICLLVVLDKDFDSHVIPLVFPQVLTD